MLWYSWAIIKELPAVKSEFYVNSACINKTVIHIKCKKNFWFDEIYFIYLLHFGIILLPLVLEMKYCFFLKWLLGHYGCTWNNIWKLNMQKGFMWLCVTGTVLDNDCCVQTPRKNCPPKVHKFSKTPGVTSKF